MNTNQNVNLYVNPPKLLNLETYLQISSEMKVRIAKSLIELLNGEKCHLCERDRDFRLNLGSLKSPRLRYIFDGFDAGDYCDY